MHHTYFRAASVLHCSVLLYFCSTVAAKENGDQIASGRELFTREWLPGDSRSANGDGLGPMFNESSCVSCHNQGGVGGGGPESKNVEILSVVALADQPADDAETSRKPKGRIATTLGVVGGRLTQAIKTTAAIKDDLKKLHPDLVGSRSTMLHRFSVDPQFQSWRNRLERETVATLFIAEVSDRNDLERFGEDNKLGLRDIAKAEQEINAIASRGRSAEGPREVDGFALSISQRNTTALYGAGLVDSVSTEVLIAASEERHEEFPEITGRVSKLKDGRLGRFGWKAQHATLTDFSLTACAVELGLDVPDHPQSRPPHKSDSAEHSHDMTPAECSALVEFVAHLSRPVERTARSEHEAKTVAAGKEHFAAVGCTACHVPKLGDVDGLYSDLLVHDMGPNLGDVGVYGGTLPNSSDDTDGPLPLLAAQAMQRPPTEEELAKTVGALRQEWRTPPLWGFRDSAPYLHDGRAATLHQAVALHGGEARRSALRYFALPAAQREELHAFLKSLTAPGL